MRFSVVLRGLEVESGLADAFVIRVANAGMRDLAENNMVGRPLNLKIDNRKPSAKVFEVSDHGN